MIENEFHSNEFIKHNFDECTSNSTAFAIFFIPISSVYELSKKETKGKNKSLVLCSALKCIFIKNFSHLHCNMLDIVNYSFVILYDGGKMKFFVQNGSKCSLF